MNSAMTVAVSGMLAAAKSFTASASNLADLESDGPAPAAGPQQPVSPVPGRVSQPSGNLASNLPASFADIEGENPARDRVNQITASLAYRANIATFKTAQEMEKTLLDALA
ncbi:MAG TPA: hypothetical protein VN718_02490 [Rhizomicrobium sp.]|nr:hypothetical protein [Rhizomicrobium sp.]